MSSFVFAFPIFTLNALLGFTAPPTWAIPYFCVSTFFVLVNVRPRPNLARFTLLGLALFVGANLQKQSFVSVQHRLPKETVRLLGTVTDLQTRFDGAQKGILNLSGYLKEDKHTPLKARLNLVLKRSAAHDKMPTGSIVLIEGRISIAEESDLPWGFNEREFGLSRNKVGRLTVHDRQKIFILSRKSSPSRFANARERLRERIGALVLPREGSLLLALMIGDTANFAPEQRRLYQDVGAGHLLAVSGLQVTLFAVILYFLLFRVPLLWHSETGSAFSQWARSAFLLAVIWGYVGLCAWPASAIRAATMATLGLLAVMCGRRVSMSHVLCTSGSLALLWRPAQILDPSFLLSYAALFGLLLLPLPKRRHSVSGLLLTWLLGSLGSSLGTAPFVARFFGVFIPGGFLANVFLIPVASFVQIPALFFATAGMLFDSPELCHWGAFCAAFLESICELGCGWLPGPIPIPTPSWPRTYVWVLLLCFVRHCLHRPSVVSFLWLTFFLGAVTVTVPGRPALQIDVLPVGHGDASFVTFTNGQTMMIDGGGNPQAPQSPLHRSIQEFFERRNIKSIDVVVLSHPDPDHILGLLHVVKEVSVGEIWHSGFTAKHPLMKLLLQDAKVKGIPVITGRDLTVPRKYGQTEVSVLHPFASPDQVSVFSEFETNDNSLVLSLEHLGKRLLWTGDVEFFGERELLKKKAPLRADVIKAAHHGSNTSSQEALVRAVRPQHVLFTVPQRSRFGFPKTSIKKRWLSVGSQLWSTGDHGLLHLTVDEAGVRITPTRVANE